MLESAGGSQGAGVDFGIAPMPAELTELCGRLAEAASQLDSSGQWPARQLGWCAEAGVFRWFIPPEYGGLGWSEQQILNGYLSLSRACLTTTFVLTQWNAASRRIVGSSNEQLRRQMLPRMANGELFTTVGISHLSTSRQHVTKPVLRATPQADGGWLLDGYSPWVTGASAADVIVTGATLDDGRQLMCAVDTRRTGVEAERGQSLVALTASCTDKVQFVKVRVDAEHVIAGPMEHVLQSNSGGGTGGLQTSTLAVGLSMAAVDLLHQESLRRSDLRSVFQKLKDDTEHLHRVLIQLTDGNEVMPSFDLRRLANSLALRSTQAALSAAKGAGFVAAHPAGRLAREALFFLVWSCPQNVVDAHLCELAQLAE
jgi:alkylation response protein AidB-like acyl-CoA dehydrogenase